MNIPSHYQSAFFAALAGRDDIDLQVRYLKGVSSGRAAEGWNNEFECQSYEAFAGEGKHPGELVASLTDWQERTHIISSYFNTELIGYFCVNHVRWCHWSEMPGIRLADLLGYRMDVFRRLNPLMLMLKRKEGLRIRRHAVGAFGQGTLAAHAFRRMGVPSGRIANLFYTPGPLPEASPCKQIVQFAQGRTVFLSVGALCRRKGIDVLLRAFSQTGSNSSCLVFCGLDKAGGEYQALAEKLGISDRVLFMGAYPADRISEVYAAADVFVLASRFDGWGAVLNEAASCGLPLIATDLSGGAWHLIQEGENGFRVTAGAVGPLAVSLKYYMANPAQIKEHGGKSKQLYVREFTPEKNAERMAETLNTWLVK